MRAVLLLALMMSGCASVLGIEEAVCDPDTDANCAVATTGDDDEGEDGPDDDQEGDGGLPVFTRINDLCKEYCERVDATCTTENDSQQYPSVNACVAVCQQGMDLGLPGDKDERVDTGYCRLENVLNAGAFGEVEVDCAAAGLGANGACGDICEVYCELLGDVCEAATTVQDVDIVFDDDACLAECEELPRTPEPFDFEVTTGNTLECRLWHVQAAFGNRGTHCPHAVGLDQCVP
jgi:hypothetical protein